MNTLKSSIQTVTNVKLSNKFVQNKMQKVGLTTVLSKATMRSTRPIAAICQSKNKNNNSNELAGIALAAVLTFSSAAPALARLDPVNNPDLLPASFTTVIDTAGFLTPGEEDRMVQKIDRLEKDTGFKLRVLCQNYPNTPGLAIRDYWGVDANSIVFVADPNFGNILNFNVGANLDLQIPQNFWTRLAGKFGTKKYWTENGNDTSIVNTVAAIDSCLREPIGVGQCSKIKGVLEQ
eukprot:CAMPEP_0196573262 /NCGR_PEP_ID=MMETSP1081-20130531/3192_1 /TAXON_ID=36882 /ORGANISM="Pyramimonas amylifera, Strain CCMP720" /LENGTH=234 /DNA_ID=CAMNT_0041890907 /DNA_START=71 /DNA_END=775 /DNA_ORIENTATION=+